MNLAERPALVPGLLCTHTHWTLQGLKDSILEAYCYGAKARAQADDHSGIIILAYPPMCTVRKGIEKKLPCMQMT
eukprot:194338-Amphidinium_carterae.1